MEKPEGGERKRKRKESHVQSRKVIGTKTERKSGDQGKLPISSTPEWLCQLYDVQGYLNEQY